MNEFNKNIMNNTYRPDMNKANNFKKPDFDPKSQVINGELQKSLNMQQQTDKIFKGSKQFQRNTDLNDLARREKLNNKFDR